MALYHKFHWSLQGHIALKPALNRICGVTGSCSIETFIDHTKHIELKKKHCIEGVNNQEPTSLVGKEKIRPENRKCDF